MPQSEAMQKRIKAEADEARHEWKEVRILIG